MSLSHLQKNIQKHPSFGFLAKLFVAFSSAEVFVVGGAVRDALLSRTSKDIDFVVRGVSPKKLQLFLEEHGTVNLVGKKFGVFKFVPHDMKGEDGFEPFDISLPRTEFSIQHTGHYRDFSIQTDYRLSIEADLSRRDFTINAMAWNVATCTLVDPFRGQEDICKKIIRTVGTPRMRFAEDYSRMLRALRFSCQLGFTLDPQTHVAIQKEIKKLNKEMTVQKGRTQEAVRVVPNEVIAREMVKSLVANPIRAFDLFDEFSVFKTVIPEMMKMRGCVQDPQWHSEGDVWTHARLTLAEACSKSFQKEFLEHASPLLLLIAFLHDIGKPYTIQTPEKDGVDRIHFYGHDRVGADLVRSIFERLRFSSVEQFDIKTEDAVWLVKNHLLLLNSDISSMKNTTIEKYFFADPVRGKHLLELIYIDSRATVRKDKKTSLGSYRQCKKRLALLTALSGNKRVLPQSLINGGEIMKACKLKPGPRIGEIIALLREEQLAKRITTKRAAILYVKKYAKS